MADHTPSRVRAFLREELPRWRAEGILDDQGAETLTRRYLAEPEATGTAIAALYVLAAGMVGAGIISLVAWHWDELARSARLGILGTALVAAHGIGFWMWQVHARRPRLGHAVSLLGTLIFGASIGLVAQIFHVSGPWYGAFGAWALGALAAGLILPSLPTLGFALVLALFVWGPGFISDHREAADGVAWLAGGIAVALAFRARSRVLFVVAAVGLAVVLGVAAVKLEAPRSAEPALLFGTLLAWAAAVSASSGLRVRGAPHAFAGAAAVVGRVALYLLAWGLSFVDAADDVLSPRVGWDRAFGTCVLPLLVVAAALLVGSVRGPPAEEGRPRTAFIGAAFAALFSTLALTDAPPIVLAVAANAVLLAVAALQIANGLRTRRRAPFWDGLAVAAVTACSRFLEVDELLWLKGLGFIACGIAVTLAAVAFEKRVLARRAEVHHA